MSMRWFSFMVVSGVLSGCLAEKNETSATINAPVVASANVVALGEAAGGEKFRKALHLRVVVKRLAALGGIGDAGVLVARLRQVVGDAGAVAADKSEEAEVDVAGQAHRDRGVGDDGEPPLEIGELAAEVAVLLLQLLHPRLQVGVDRHAAADAAAVGGGHLDDFILMDTSGSTMNGFLGDTRIDKLTVTGDGGTHVWIRVNRENHAQVRLALDELAQCAQMLAHRLAEVLATMRGDEHHAFSSRPLLHEFDGFSRTLRRQSLMQGIHDSIADEVDRIGGHTFIEQDRKSVV